MKAAIALLLFALLILPTLWKVRIVMDRTSTKPGKEDETGGSPPLQ